MPNLFKFIQCIIIPFMLVDNHPMLISGSPEESNFQSTLKPPATKEKDSLKGASGKTQESWIAEAVRDVAYYLRSHKFNEFDRRYYRKDVEDKAPHNLFSSFPDPPLRSVHWEVRRHCIISFKECLRYIQHEAKRAPLRRIDDTLAVALEQNWTSTSDAKALKVTNDQCLTLYQEGHKTGKPFQGPLERFQWRTSASYFMCWYTMLEERALETIGERCDNYASCLNPTFGMYNRDFRAVDNQGKEIPFACAQYSFCPDPCCPKKHYASESDCWMDDGNPCREANAEADDSRSRCFMPRARNTDFDGVMHNFWNVTCNCSTANYRRITAPEDGTFPEERQEYASVVMPDEGAFVWDSQFGMCVDVDECSAATDSCDRRREGCHNLPGGYACSCTLGHVPSSLNPRDMFPKKGKLDLQCLRDKRLQAANDIVAAIKKIKTEETSTSVGNVMYEDVYTTFLKSVLHALRFGSIGKKYRSYEETIKTVMGMVTCAFVVVFHMMTSKYLS